MTQKTQKNKNKRQKNGEKEGDSQQYINQRKKTAKRRGTHPRKGPGPKNKNKKIRQKGGGPTPGRGRDQKINL